MSAGDGKLDWQRDRCPECGFDPAAVGPGELPDKVAGLGRRYTAPLTRLLPGEDDTILRAHPLEGTWSALAYACHVRDVLALFHERIRRMLSEDGPTLASWDHEAAVEDTGYDGDDPAAVAAAVAENAAALSATLTAVPDGAWERAGVREDGTRFTVLGAARYVVHEGNHHLLDLGRVLRTARGR